ncbi:C6 zinc finger domain-containing protein [Verticillium alfalfae VaMs.102]|uniref:C6 zinc finger domain-containing protein n=1 Tax=Verticillium alfalfae (strain VaMs.102 / ATCC MYA-4576 / FGSC 10136) TaxID=526221 RepID=C9SWT9_VERA1|nr:C6 zinc finger domain-containing protein [Verticillium alfalfae VaMs.102]EEY23480.1 C6 zinc finger domain-containing protein [Verticillium alfalfae VaMs.102]
MGSSVGDLPHDPRSETADQPIQPAPRTRPAPRGTASYQRKRAVKACQVCRARRTKCDNLKPSCSFCLKVGAKCIQSPVDLSSFDPASLKILERLDDLEELMRSVSVQNTELPHKIRAVDTSQPSIRPSEATNSLRDVNEQQATALPLSIDTIIPPPPGRIISMELFSRKLSPEQEHYSLLHPDQTVVSAISPASTIGILDMEPRRVNDLLDSFFSFVHVKNPILDETSTRHMVLSTIMNGVDWSPESCLALLVCALGSLSTSFGPSHDAMPGTIAYNNAMAFFQAAQKRLGLLISSDELIGPQCLFLAGVFMMCVFQPLKAWRYFLQALAGCQQLPFLAQENQEKYHGISDGSHPQDHAIDTLQQAVYWSAWKSEREVRSTNYMPDFVNDMSTNIYPPFFPTPPAPRTELDTSADPRREREQISWYFYLAEISLRRLTARMSAGMMELQAQHEDQQSFLAAMAAVVPEHEAQVNSWISSLPPNLSFEAPPEEDDVCRFVLRGHAINLFELIYWPFISAYLTCEDLSRSFASTSSNIAHYAERSLHYHLVRLKLNKPGYRHRHHGTNPMMQTCSRSALVLLGASIKCETTRAQGTDRGGTTVTLPQGWQEGIDDIVDLLDYWGNETRDFGKIRTVLDQGRMPANGSASWTYAPQTYM